MIIGYHTSTDLLPSEKPARHPNYLSYLHTVKFYLLLPLLALGLFSSCSKKAATSSSSHALKTEDFPAFIANPGTLNIVDFSATWCPPCQQLKPVLAAIADEHSDTVRLGIVDVDDEKSLAAQQGVRGIPDVRFYVNGKQVDKFTGAAPKDHIEQIIAHLLAKYDRELKQPGHPTPVTEEPIETLPIIPPTTPNPDLIPPPTESPTPAPAASSNPTIEPSKENPLPPGMSKQ